MNHVVTERPHTNGVVLLKSGRTIRIDHRTHHASGGDRLAVVLLFTGLVVALLTFAFVRIGIPLIRHFAGS